MGVHELQILDRISSQKKWKADVYKPCTPIHEGIHTKHLEPCSCAREQVNATDKSKPQLDRILSITRRNLRPGLVPTDFAGHWFRLVEEGQGREMGGWERL